MDEIKDRIALIIDFKKLNSSNFADAVGIQRSRMSHIMSGRNNPSIDVIIRIVDTYSDINIEWLINGKGNMLTSYKTNSLLNDISESINSDVNNSFVSDKALYNDETVSNKLLIPFKDHHSGKKIDRIIVFYTDDSFKEYRPE